MTVLDTIISILPLAIILLVGDHMGDKIARLPYGAGLLLAFGGMIAGMGSVLWIGDMAIASQIATLLG